MGDRGPKCTVCSHPEHWRLEQQRAAGLPLSTLAKHYKLSKAAIDRHWRNHVTDKAKATYLSGPSELAELHAKAAAEGESVLDYLRIVRNSLTAAMATASELGDPRGVATVATALVGCLEKLGKITGEIANLGGGNTFNIAVLQSPEWAGLCADLIAELAPHPEARVALVAMLRRRDEATAGASAMPALAAPRRTPVTIEHEPAASVSRTSTETRDPNNSSVTVTELSPYLSATERHRNASDSIRCTAPPPNQSASIAGADPQPLPPPPPWPDAPLPPPPGEARP